MNERYASKSLLRNCICSMCNVTCVTGLVHNFRHLRSLAITSLVQMHLQTHFCNFSDEYQIAMNSPRTTRSSALLPPCSTQLARISSGHSYSIPPLKSSEQPDNEVLNGWTHLTGIPFRGKSSLAGGGKYLSKLWIP